jgi:hypothetical protein
MKMWLYRRKEGEGEGEGKGEGRRCGGDADKKARRASLLRSPSVSDLRLRHGHHSWGFGLTGTEYTMLILVGIYYI